MPVNGTSTLVEYEAKRQSLKFVPYVSDTSDVGESKVEIRTVRGLPSNPRFDLEVKSKNLSVGPNDFFVIGDQMDPEHVYRYLTVGSLAELRVQQQLVITGPKKIDRRSVPGQLIVDGKVVMQVGSALVISNGATVAVPELGSLRFERGSNLIVSGGKLVVRGYVYLPQEMIPVFTHTEGIELASSAVIKVTEVPGSRIFSLADYVAELYRSYQQVGTGSARSMSAGSATASFKCVAGDKELPYQVLELSVDRGEVILGDLDIKLHGQADEPVANYRSIRSLTVAEGAQLTIGREFMGDTYLSPRLMIGTLSPGDQPGELRIAGKVLVADGSAVIDLSDGGQITIEDGGELVLTGGGRLNHHDATSRVVINGKLVIDDISDLGSTEPDNYVFGPNGKLIVRNPSPANDWERKTLLSIPAGFGTSQLATLFGDRLAKVEYHLSKNCGLVIDTDMSPMRDWTDWYNGVRLERAIANGWLVWHDGAYLEADRSVLPWLTVARGLGQASKLFKSYRPTERGRLQDLADRLSYAGSGDMVFRFTDVANNLVAETTLSLRKCELLAVSHNPLTGSYGVTASDEGELFLVSPPEGTEPENIVTETAKVVTLPATHRTTFRLP